MLRRGDTGIGVQTIRFYLAFLGFFLPELPPIRISDVFDDELRDAVLAFQSTYGLTVDGVVGRNTWNAIRNVYEQTLYQLPPEYQTFARQIYPGRFLVEGDTGAEVTLLQTQLNRLAQRGQRPALRDGGRYLRRGHRRRCPRPAKPAGIYSHRRGGPRSVVVYHHPGRRLRGVLNKHKRLLPT